MRKLLCAGAMAFVLAGCSSYGNRAIKNETAATIDQKIQDGVTTKDQVKTMFGDPLEINYTDGGREVWKYEFKTLHENGENYIPYYSAFSNGRHGKAKTVLLIFDDKGHVWHHTFAESKISTHSGVAD